MNFHASFAIKPALEWSIEADDIVRDGYHRGKSYNAIAHDLRRIDLLRSGTAVIKRCERLKLPLRSHVGNKWTADMKNRARELWDAGKSASQVALVISAEYGTPVTRNAVIGLSNREAFTTKKTYMNEAQYLQRKIKRAKEDAQKKREARAAGNLTPRQSDSYPRKAYIPPQLVNDLAIPQEQRRTLMELKRHHCRWPVGNVGELDFFFCGGTKAENSSYCPGHKHVATC